MFLRKFLYEYIIFVFFFMSLFVLLFFCEKMLSGIVNIFFFCFRVKLIVEKVLFLVEVLIIIKYGENIVIILFFCGKFIFLGRVSGKNLDIIYLFFII